MTRGREGPAGCLCVTVTGQQALYHGPSWCSSTHLSLWLMVALPSLCVGASVVLSKLGFVNALVELPVHWMLIRVKLLMQHLWHYLFYFSTLLL